MSFARLAETETKDLLWNSSKSPSSDDTLDKRVEAARVLFVIHTSTVFVECFRLAKLLVREGIKPVFTFAYADWTIEAFSNECKEAAIEVYRPSYQRKTTPFEIFRHLASIVLDRWPSLFLSFILEFLQLQRSVSKVRTVFKTIKPDLLVLSIDLAGYDSCAYVKVAHEFGRKVILISSIMSNGLDQAEVYYHDRNHHVAGPLRRLVARAFPKWIICHRLRSIFRVPPGRVVAMELLGLAPPKPWLFNSSMADVITMESAAMVEYSAAAGMPREQMALTGSTTDDVMAAVQAESQKRRTALCQSLGFPTDSSLILTAVPPNFLNQPGGRPECDFNGNYESLVDFWLKSCSGFAGYNVVVALHPSVPPSEIHKFERYGARVARLNTAELIPLCDIFVASISSTIRWAIACEKPVVNYDVYRYRYTDFVDLEGVLTCEEQEEFRALLARLTSDPKFAAEIRRRQTAVSRQWGCLDGRSGQRLVELVERCRSVRRPLPVS